MKKNNKKNKKNKSIRKVFISRGLKGAYSIEEIMDYVESLKRSGPCSPCAPFEYVVNDLRNTLLDEVIFEFYTSDVPF